MKIKGSYFKRCLEQNVINVANGKIQIHSYDDQSHGIYRVIASECGPEPFLFWVKGADAAIISNFNDLDMSLCKDSPMLEFKAEDANLHFVLPKNYHEDKPEIADVVETYVRVPELMKAVSIADKDDKQITNKACGILFSTDGFSIYDDKNSLYYRYIGNKNELVSPVRVPVYALKLIDSAKEYQVCVGKKSFVLKAEDEIVYSSVYEGYVPAMVAYDPKPAGMIELENSGEFRRHIQIAEAFGNLVRIEVSGDSMHIENYLNNDDPRMYQADMPVKTNIEKYSMLWNARSILTMITKLQYDRMEKMQMFVDDRCMRINRIDRYMVTAATLNDENIKLQLKETEGKTDGE